MWIMDRMNYNTLKRIAAGQQPTRHTPQWLVDALLEADLVAPDDTGKLTIRPNGRDALKENEFWDKA